MSDGAASSTGPSVTGASQPAQEPTHELFQGHSYMAHLTSSSMGHVLLAVPEINSTQVSDE